MDLGYRLLRNDELDDYEMVKVFARGFITTWLLNTKDIVIHSRKKRRLSRNKDIIVKLFHTSPLWLDNRYSNILN